EGVEVEASPGHALSGPHVSDARGRKEPARKLASWASEHGVTQRTRRQRPRGTVPKMWMSWLLVATYGRHGSLRSAGHAGSGVGAGPSGVTGRTKYEPKPAPRPTVTVLVPVAGSVSTKFQIGWSPLRPEMVTRIWDPAR